MQIMYSMITNYTKATILLGLFLIIASCAEDGLVEETPRVITPEPQEIIDATLYGRVLSPTGQPVSDAQVSYLTGLTPELTTTDSDGYFLIKNVRNKGKSAFISVRSGNYFEAFRRYSVLPGRYNYTEVKMAERTVIGTVQSKDGGSLSQSEGAKITLPANGIISSDGSKYEGSVDVAMNWINPTSEALSAEMVGDLSGIDEEGTIRSLTTYGMLQVELIGSSGQLLNLAGGFEAQLSFPIPNELQGLATPSIPLWSYNEISGTWIQEGTAIKEGNAYVGSVSHFSSWNVDHMTDPMEIKGTVKFVVSEEISGAGYLQVKVCSDNIGTKGGWLCEDGSFRFYNFPKDEEFKIKVYDHCGNKLYQETYGPYQSDTELDPIVVENSNNVIRVVGNAITCEDEVVSNARLSIRLDDRYLDFPVNENGEFNFTVDVCNEKPIEITIIDLDVFLEKTFTINPSEQKIEVFDIKVCDELEEYIIVKIDTFAERILTNNFFIFDQPLQDSLGIVNATKILFESEDSLSFERFNLIFRNIENLPETQKAISFEFSSNQFWCRSEQSDINVTIISFGVNQGDIIEGSFVGTLFCTDAVDGEIALDISGSFKVKRQ